MGHDMLTHPTLDLLHQLGLHGMAKGLQDLAANSEARNLEHTEWLGLLLEYEQTLRRQKRFETRARVARLRQAATVEDVDYHAVRGLDRGLFLKPAAMWLDPSSLQSDHNRPIWRRQNLVRLRTGAQGLQG
jgi:hypothetical protein